MSRRVVLHNPEHVIFRVLAVNQVADAGNRGLGNDDFASMLRDFGGEIVNRRNVNRVDEIDRALAFENTAVDTRLLLRARRDEPVVFRPALFLRIPSEDILVKLDGALRLVRADFKMNYSRHLLLHFGSLCR